MIIGIDLGTTNSLACVYRDGGAELIPNSLGEYLTPSVVSFEGSGEVVVGAVARERLVTNPEVTAASFKRFMGSQKVYCLAGREFTPQELSAFVLRQLKQDAERYLGEEVTEAVISVPAYFNNHQRAATLEAGKLAGIHVERLVNEPSAAALASSMMSEEEEQVYLVFDFGGGTLDVSVVDYFNNVIEIVAVSGDNHLGGNDFDAKIAQHFCASHNIEMEQLPPQKQATLRRLAEKAKRELSEQETTFIHMDIEGEDKAVILNSEVLIKSCGALFDRMEKAVRHALRDSGYHVEDISEIILAGGSSKMPVVSYFLQNLLGKKPCMIGSPDEVIALGAGIYAGIKARKEEIRDMLLTDICPFTLGVGVYNPGGSQPNMSPLIERNSVLPISRTGVYTNVEDRQRQIDFKIYQGESFNCAENLCLGAVSIPIAPVGSGQASINVTFSYDINGILVVDVEDNQSTNKKQVIFRSEGMNLSDKELARKVEELKKYRSDFEGDERDRLLLARGNRLYQELKGINRDHIRRAMREYEYAMSVNDKHAKLVMRQQITAMFDRFEEFLDEY
ncbi:MAG: molecular chaperone HscC [Lachnospiraceae bacterium]|nr:molecular chaperone HscC [Lachnospiraceae bacterium]